MPPTLFQFYELWMKIDPKVLTLPQLQALRKTLLMGVKEIDETIKNITPSTPNSLET